MNDRSTLLRLIDRHNRLVNVAYLAIVIACVALGTAVLALTK